MNDKNHQFKCAFDCVRQIMVKEGPFGFFKGFGMCWARVCIPFRPHHSSARADIVLYFYFVQLGTHTILTFLIYERVRYLFGIEAM